VASNAQAAAELPRASTQGLAERAAQLRARAGVQVIDGAQLARWRADPQRTLYLFDVRPVPGAASAAAADVRHVPGGQVLMHFEQLVGTRNARVVLVDDAEGLRAAVTAFWLRQFNQCEVAVLEGEAPPSHPPADSPREADDAASQGIDAPTLQDWLARDEATVVHVGPSEDFERRHVPGARYLLPASMAPLAALVAQGRPIVFTSEDAAAARIAARDAARTWPDAPACHWLIGGLQTWASPSRPTTADYAPQDLLSPFDDDWGSTMRVRPEHREAAWRDYLAWERALSVRVMRDPNIRFNFLPIADTRRAP